MEVMAAEVMAHKEDMEPAAAPMSAAVLVTVASAVRVAPELELPVQPEPAAPPLAVRRSVEDSLPAAARLP